MLLKEESAWSVQEQQGVLAGGLWALLSLWFSGVRQMRGSGCNEGRWPLEGTDAPSAVKLTLLTLDIDTKGFWFVYYPFHILVAFGCIFCFVTYTVIGILF